MIKMNKAAFMSAVLSCPTVEVGVRGVHKIMTAYAEFMSMPPTEAPYVAFAMARHQVIGVSHYVLAANNGRMNMKIVDVRISDEAQHDIKIEYQYALARPTTCVCSMRINHGTTHEKPIVVTSMELKQVRTTNVAAGTMIGWMLIIGESGLSISRRIRPVIAGTTAAPGTTMPRFIEVISVMDASVCKDVNGEKNIPIISRQFVTPRIYEELLRAVPDHHLESFIMAMPIIGV